MERIAADIVLLAHFAFVAFVAAGALLVVRWPRVAWAHVPAAAWGVFIELTGRICPLTVVENRLRRAAGDDIYTGSFIDHYITPVLYPPGLTRGVQLSLALAVLLVNLAAYGWMLYRRRR